MLSGQLLQQLTVLRGRNVGEFVLAFLIVEVADDDQLGAICQACPVMLAIASFSACPGPSRRVDDLVAGPGRQLVQADDRGGGRRCRPCRPPFTAPVAQCSNIYSFPGFGLAVTAVRATRVTDAMMTAAAAVGDAATIRRDPHGTLLPDRAQLVGTRPTRPSTAPGATRYQS
jgi:hypothetical protein